MSGGQPAFDPGPADSGGDGDRLPWLEPYRDPAAKPPTVAKPTALAHRPAAAAPRRRRSGAGLLLGGLTALALGAGGYWVGRVSAPGKLASPHATVVTTLPYRSLDDQPAEPVVAGGSVGDTAVEPATVGKAMAPVAGLSRLHVHHRPVRTRIVRRAVPHVVVHHQAYRRSVVPPPPPPPPPLPRKLQRSVTPPAPVVVGKAGEVIELGVFISPRTARAAFHRVAHRYPYLGTRPRVVLPQAASAGWPAVYRLRLGTGSGRNARILCRYVHSIGQRCAVV